MGLVLSSSSPRRLDLLSRINITPVKIFSPDIEESIRAKELPNKYVSRLSIEKAEAFFLQRGEKENKEDFIVGFDTAVALGRRILPKALDLSETEKCLKLLSGRNHSVYTGISIITPCNKRINSVVMTKVRFKRLSDLDIKIYLSSKEGIGMAGGYSIQGYAESFVKSINGSYSNVVGLPLYETRNLLMGAGFKLGD